LFTETEGSTRRREADAEAIRAALLAHDEFLFSHTGDGVVATLASLKQPSMPRSMRSAH
jgi:hypothetical protein